MPKETDQKPTGLAFVLLCARLLVPTTFPDLRSDDRRALEAVVRSASTTAGRIVLYKPTPEYEDIVSGIEDNEMEEWKKRFGILADALTQAGRISDPVEACKVLVKHFGDDFPVPPPEDTGKRTKAPAITTSSVSA